MMQERENISGARKEKVEQMFNSIARHYDFLNHFLSFGTDRRWRRRAINHIGKHIKPERILDVATGTGDLAITSLMLQPSRVTGIDISGEMLALGRKKIAEKGLSGKIELVKGDSESMFFPDNVFDVAMAAFGVRNFENTLMGLSEMYRVLRPGGMIMVLEFSKPTAFPLKQLYSFYFMKILPLAGRLISGDRDAYSYLPESVMGFPDNEEFLELLGQAGFVQCKQLKLSGGIASVYSGFKE